MVLDRALFCCFLEESSALHESRHSSVSLWLLLGVIVLFGAVVDELDGVGILSTSVGALPLLVGHERLHLVDIVELTVRKPKMVPFVETPPDGRDCVGCSQVDKLGQVEDVEELDAVASVEPHPVSVGLQAHGLDAEKLEES